MFSLTFQVQAAISATPKEVVDVRVKRVGSRLDYMSMSTICANPLTKGSVSRTLCSLQVLWIFFEEIVVQINLAFFSRTN